MVDQELTSRLTTPLEQQASNTSQAEENPFERGVTPALLVDQIRSDILRRATEPRNVEDRKVTTSPSENTELPSSSLKNPEGAVPAPLSEKTPSPSLLRMVGDALRAVGTQVVSVGEKLRGLPGVQTTIGCLKIAAEFVVKLLYPERPAQTAVRHQEVPRSDNTLHTAPVQLTRSPDSATFAILKLKILDDPLESSARFHAALIEAARELGEAAQRRDDKEKKEAEARMAEEDRLERLAAETVRLIDNLSGTSNGETQSIIQKLSGPFAISGDHAIRLAREAEQRELSALKRLELESDSLTKLIDSIDTAKYRVGASV